MKKSILTIVFALITVLSFSQEATEKTITVRGDFYYKPQIEQYKVVMNLMLENNYNSSKRYSSIEELKKGYFKKLSEEKIDTTKFVEDKLAFHSSGGYGEGTYLVYTTTSETEANKLADIIFDMVRLRHVMTRYTSIENQYDTYIKKTLKIAKNKAVKLAKLKGVKLGEIIHFSEGSDYSPEWSSSHYFSYEMKLFQLIVTFKME